MTIVIDTGRMKEMRYDADNKMSMLVEDWVSKANSKQRRGRAGRVQKGRCYFMYSRRQEERLKSAPTPEIQLACLDQLCLQITGERRGEGEERERGGRGEGPTDVYISILSYANCPSLPPSLPPSLTFPPKPF